MAKLMDGCFHSHETTEHTIKIAYGNHWNPQAVREEVEGEVNKREIYQKDAASL
jgi:hypothetical protein